MGVALADFWRALWGWGPGFAASDQPHSNHPHNVLLQLGYEWGGLALAVSLLVVGRLLWLAYKHEARGGEGSLHGKGRCVGVHSCCLPAFTERCLCGSLYSVVACRSCRRLLGNVESGGHMSRKVGRGNPEIILSFFSLVLPFMAGFSGTRTMYPSPRPLLLWLTSLLVRPAMSCCSPRKVTPRSPVLHPLA